jgi:hypothetical protein
MCVRGLTGAFDCAGSQSAFSRNASVESNLAGAEADEDSDSSRISDGEDELLQRQGDDDDDDSTSSNDDDSSSSSSSSSEDEWDESIRLFEKDREELWNVLDWDPERVAQETEAMVTAAEEVRRFGLVSRAR